jgi:hypothetical protein
LFPQPSDDINDPFNGPKWKKTVDFISIIFYAFLKSWVLGVITLEIPGMIQALKIDLNWAITGLNSWAVVTLSVAVMHSLIFPDLYRTFCETPIAHFIGKQLMFLSFHSLPFAATI